MALNIPKQIRAGDTLRFTDEHSNYPAPEWKAHYIMLRDGVKYELESVADGSAHSFDFPYTTTQQWNAGRYKYQCFVSNSGDRFTVGSGETEILADFKTTSKDQRSHVERVLESIEAVIEGRATHDQQEVAFNGRKLVHMPIADLLKWRTTYKAELVRCKQAEKFGGLKNIMVRF